MKTFSLSTYVRLNLFTINHNTKKIMYLINNICNIFFLGFFANIMYNKRTLNI